jgi:prolipoprotein diacylglyceryltransferase
MRIHPVLILQTLLHFFVSVIFFYLIFSYADEDNEAGYLTFAYLVCIALFRFIGPLLISRNIKVEFNQPKYVAGSFLILFLNLFVPYLGLLFTFRLENWLRALHN